LKTKGYNRFNGGYHPKKSAAESFEGAAKNPVAKSAYFGGRF